MVICISATIHCEFTAKNYSDINSVNVSVMSIIFTLGWTQYISYTASSHIFLLYSWQHNMYQPFGLVSVLLLLLSNLDTF